MFDISIGEVVLVLLIAMIFLGPDRLPKVARRIGEFLRMLRDAFFQVKEEITQDEDAAKVFNEMQSTVTDIANAVNIKKLVREMGTPLMERVDIRDNSSKTKELSNENNQEDTEHTTESPSPEKSDDVETIEDIESQEDVESQKETVTHGVVEQLSSQSSRSYKIDRKFKRVDD